MAEPRKIVLILGNGFDIDLGLKTSYQYYWESEFCPKDYPAPIIRHLNSWNEDLSKIRWCDLENELLKYAKEGDKTDVITEAEQKYIERNDDYQLYSKAHYLGVDETFIALSNKRLIDRQDSGVRLLYRNDLLKPVQWRDREAFLRIENSLKEYLYKSQAVEIKRDSTAGRVLIALLNEYDVGNEVDIFSFNYTDLALLKSDSTDIHVQYIHGSCQEEHIIVGTRYDKEIGDDYDFLFKTRDTDYHPPRIIDSINDADEVVFFGHSFGENDQPYFADLFKDQLKTSPTHRKDVVIFTLDQESEQNIKRALDVMIDGQSMRLMTVNPPTIIKTSNLKGKDGWLFKDFLVKHGMESHDAEVVIGNILKKQAV